MREQSESHLMILFPHFITLRLRDIFTTLATIRRNYSLFYTPFSLPIHCVLIIVRNFYLTMCICSLLNGKKIESQNISVTVCFSFSLSRFCDLQKKMINVEDEKMFSFKTNHKICLQHCWFRGNYTHCGISLLVSVISQSCCDLIFQRLFCFSWGLFSRGFLVHSER